MRIAYLINQYPKISHTFVRREIHALERQGAVVTRIALRGWDADLIDADDKSEQQKTCYVLREPGRLISTAIMMALSRPVQFCRGLRLAWQMSRKSDRPLLVHVAYLAEACRVLPWLIKQRIEHLHAHFGTNSAEVAMLVHVLGGPNWSFTVHGPEEFDKPEFIGLPEKIRRCAFVVAVSSFGRSQLFRLVEHKLWQKVHVVHCGIEPDFYQNAVISRPVAHTLVCVGRLCEQKGQLLLLDAVRRLRDSGVQLKLVLAGDGEMRSELERLVSLYSLDDVVRITGWIGSDQVRDEILAARALVLPSFAEGLPVVIMEAMALRRPVISTFVAAIPELVISGEQGWLVPAGDLECLAHAMRDCLDTSLDKIVQMGEAAHARVLERHDVDREAAKMIELIRRLSSPKEGLGAAQR